MEDFIFKEPPINMFTNNVTVDANFYEVSLTLGLHDKFGNALEPNTIVHMSPQFAKVLSIVLVQTIADIERENGPINLPQPPKSNNTPQA